FMARKSLASLYWKPASPWWDNRQQPSMDGRQASIEQAWVRTLESLSDALGNDPQKWTWDQLASLQHKHPLADKLPLGGRLNSERVAINGTTGSLNNMVFNLGGAQYDVIAGPSTRRLIDLAEPAASLGIGPMGQSGNPLDRHYADQAQLFAQGNYRAQLFDWLGIQALPDRLVLMPRRRKQAQPDGGRDPPRTQRFSRRLLPAGSGLPMSRRRLLIPLSTSPSTNSGARAPSTSTRSRISVRSMRVTRTSQAAACSSSPTGESRSSSSFSALSILPRVAAVG